jgi:DNA-binding CsgD family transcriptional regulator
MTQDLPDISLDWLFHRLYTHVGVSDSAPLIAIVYWAGEPLAEVQEPDNGQLTDEEIKFLVCLAKGLDGEGVAHVMGLAKSTSDNRLGNLYRKMGATNAVHAVALAARDGLLDTWFGTIEIEAAQANQFSGLFIRYLAIRANGTDKVRAAGPLGISSGRTLERRIKGDRDRMSLPLITTIAILVRKGEISVNGPSVLPKPAPAAEAAIVEGSTTEAEAAAQPTASSAVPATQPRKTVVARTNELVAGNRYQNIVIKGTASVAKPLAQYIASNFPDVIAGIRATEIDAPWWHDRYVSTGQLSTSVELFLQLLANGQSLEEVRSAFTEIVDTEPQAFRKWYMKFVCGPLGAPGPREAACITLWKGQIE